MKKIVQITVFVIFAAMLSTGALATNGNTLINVGPVSRAMGGVGIAAPQDAISAVFANPAAMCFGPYCPSTQVDFAKSQAVMRLAAKVEHDDPAGAWKLLKNVAPRLYRDKIENEVTGKDGGPVKVIIEDYREDAEK